MFSITDLMRNTADVLNYVQKHGTAIVKGRGRPMFTVIETEEYEALLRKSESLECKLALIGSKNA